MLRRFLISSGKLFTDPNPSVQRHRRISRQAVIATDSGKRIWTVTLPVGLRPGLFSVFIVFMARSIRQSGGDIR
jgi:hypothetical protein